MRDGCKVGAEGLLVRLRDGRQTILSTTRSLEAAGQKRRTTDIYSNP